MRKIKRRKTSDRSETKLVKTHKYGRRRKIAVPSRPLKRRRGSESHPSKSVPKSKLTLKARKMVYAAIEAGLPLSRCRHIIGVADSTWRTYLNYGKDPRYKKYYNFLQKIKSLEKNRELEALEVIRSAAKGGFEVKQTKITNDPIKGVSITTVESTLAPQWQAAAWFLERKDKVNWGKDPIGESRTPMELAQEIQVAQSLLSTSVPTSPPEDENG